MGRIALPKKTPQEIDALRCLRREKIAIYTKVQRRMDTQTRNAFCRCVIACCLGVVFIPTTCEDYTTCKPLLRCQPSSLAWGLLQAGL